MPSSKVTDAFCLHAGHFEEVLEVCEVGAQLGELGVEV